MLNIWILYNLSINTNLFSYIFYFPLPNSAGCVAIYGDGAVYDEVCYGKYTEKHMIDLEYLKAPKTTTVKKLTTASVTALDPSDPKFIKQCLTIEEYQLLELDIREQKLINKAQKTNYQTQMNEWRDMYRAKTNDLYTTYRSITDSKQAYIDSQQQYIDKLRWQMAQCSAYSTRITDLYNSNKAYTQTLKDTSTDYYKLQTTIQQNYPAVYQDMNEWTSDIESQTPATSSTASKPSRRSTTKDTISNLFS